MFTKSKAPATRDAAGQKPTPPSIIAADMHIQGDLETQGDAQVDGIVDGDLRTRSVTIGPSATVNGTISGDVIRVAGTVNGEIHGESVYLAASARVMGDIYHKSLSIDAGAFLQGLCKRSEEAE